MLYSTSGRWNCKAEGKTPLTFQDLIVACWSPHNEAQDTWAPHTWSSGALPLPQASGHTESHRSCCLSCKLLLILEGLPQVPPLSPERPWIASGRTTGLAVSSYLHGSTRHGASPWPCAWHVASIPPVRSHLWMRTLRSREGHQPVQVILALCCTGLTSRPPAAPAWTLSLVSRVPRQCPGACDSGCPSLAPPAGLGPVFPGQPPTLGAASPSALPRTWGYCPALCASCGICARRVAGDTVL